MGLFRLMAKQVDSQTKNRAAEAGPHELAIPSAIQATELVQKLIDSGPFPNSHEARREKVYEIMLAHRTGESASALPSTSEIQNFTSIGHYLTPSTPSRQLVTLARP